MNELTISGVSVRQDEQGRFCLNDLHRAAGGEARHKPSEWLRTKQAQELISEIEKAGIPAIQSKQQLGTFAVKELVYAYAMWISPKFHLQVIRAYDADRNTTQLAIPQNYSEALKLAYEQSLVIEDQSRRLIEKDSLILASNEASIKAGEILVREFVKSVDIIDLGEKQFYEWMRSQGYVLKNSCEPNGALEKRGYFTYKPTEVEHGGKYRYTLRITPRGKVWLAARYLAWLDRDIGDAA